MAGVDGKEGYGSGGNYFNTNTLDFPGVPYSTDDFNCCHCSMCNFWDCNINNYGDINEVRNCRLMHLADLKLGSNWVRDKVVEYFNDLINIGVAGFRVDACKHMWPGDIEAVYSRLNTLNEAWFPPGTMPFIQNEVIDQGGEPITSEEYTHLGRVTEFKYGIKIGEAFRRQWPIANLRTIGPDWGMLEDDKSFIFIDNHDNQRGHGGGGTILTHKDPFFYKQANAFMLAHPYAFTRIMSSYYFDDSEAGPPSNGDDTSDVVINPDGSCGNGWVCEHRWRPITNMVEFRNQAKGQPMMNWWDNEEHQIAFSRGDRAFIAINNEEWQNMDITLQTGLPEGVYCDIISGDLVDSACTGDLVMVDGSGNAHIFISTEQDDRVVAIHVGKN